LLNEQLFSGDSRLQIIKSLHLCSKTIQEKETEEDIIARGK